MLAVDDGIWSGNNNLADIFFLVGMVLAVIAAVLAFPRNPPSPPYTAVLGWLAVGCLAFGWLVL